MKIGAQIADKVKYCSIAVFAATLVVCLVGLASLEVCT